jgi:hypothetical protein
LSEHHSPPQGRILGFTLPRRAIWVTAPVALLGLATIAKNAWDERRSIVYTKSTDTSVREGYSAANSIPLILSSLTCPCGCMKNSLQHQSALTCFQSSHAETCPVCIQIALDAKRLHDDGKSLMDTQRYMKKCA